MIYGGWLGVEGLSKKGLMEMDDSVVTAGVEEFIRGINGSGKNKIKSQKENERGKTKNKNE